MTSQWARRVAYSTADKGKEQRNITHSRGAMPCQDTLDCARMNLGGYTCQNLRCVCDPNTDTGLFPCRSKNIDLTGRTFGDKCRADYECPEELNLVCARIELRTCRCRRGYMWNVMTKTCYMIDDQPYDNGNKGFDPVREIIVPGIVIMTIGTLIYVGIKVFCNCGKFWRRRGRQLNRELDDGSHQQATWVASYRVFSLVHSVQLAEWNGDTFFACTVTQFIFPTTPYTLHGTVLAQWLSSYYFRYSFYNISTTI
ncbi:uncharacterized protein LOC110832147 isoform X6 [Zootermopsis nevadensis]|uniref:uncharacterized protein LOC110832147 isoform X6 n=1 Tax=Zootermopsis nevadensis TaxID=136037 RepID=UPI000B8E3C96|nr:uncharacterized protein LOC110832147 isoform X6 [Zootermopsis nevadensis]